MKKILLGILLIFSLAACGNDEQSSGKEKKPSKEETEITTARQTSSSVSELTEINFKDGKLKSDRMDITIDKTQTAHNNFTGEDGVLIWYTIKNKSKDKFMPISEWAVFTVKQSDVTTEYDLTDELDNFDGAGALYPMYDEKGKPLKDDKKYNKAIDDQEKFDQKYTEPAYNELLPGKSEQLVTTIPLNNTKHPVTMKVSKDQPAKVNETYKINLK